MMRADDPQMAQFRPDAHLKKCRVVRGLATSELLRREPQSMSELAHRFHGCRLVGSQFDERRSNDCSDL
jgi:hypothetical protein